MGAEAFRTHSATWRQLWTRKRLDRRARQTTTRGWLAAEDVLQVPKPTALRRQGAPLASARYDAKPKANRKSELDEHSEVRQEREREKTAAQELQERPEHRKVTRPSAPIQPRAMVQPEIGTSMEQQASESCKTSGGSSATRLQERIGRGSACPDFRGGLLVEGGMTLPSPCYVCATYVSCACGKTVDACGCSLCRTSTQRGCGPRVACARLRIVVHDEHM